MPSVIIKILKKAMRNPQFDEPGFAWMKVACYLSLTGRTDCCCWLFSVFFFCVCFFVFFFSENLKLLFLQLGGGKRWRGFFLENIFVFLEGKVIKFIVQKGYRLKNEIALFGGLFGVFNVVYPNSLI